MAAVVFIYWTSPKGFASCEHGRNNAATFSYIRNYHRCNVQWSVEWGESRPAQVWGSPLLPLGGAAVERTEFLSIIWEAYESGDLIPMCAWCQRVEVQGAWAVPPPGTLPPQLALPPYPGHGVKPVPAPKVSPVAAGSDGSSIQNVLPFPSSLSTPMRPPCC